MPLLPHSKTSHASLVVGNIRTMDPACPEAEAMAIINGRILVVGTRKEAEAACGIGYTLHEYDQGVILPGFIDSHNHMLWTAVQARLVDLDGTKSIAEVLQRVADFASRHPEVPWITSGAGWHIDTLVENRHPTAEELDQACSDRPVFLPRIGHFAAVNSIALKMAGITNDTLDPPGGKIERDAQGVATGLLKEPPAFERVERLVPPMPFEERLQAVRDMQHKYHAAGITGVIDPGIFRDDFEVYQELHRRGELTVRTVVMPRAITDKGDELMLADLSQWRGKTGDGDEWLRLGGVKVFVDGGASLGTSLMRDPYPDEICNCGIQITRTPVLQTLVDHCARHGWSMGVHAVGGKAIDLVLSAFSTVNANLPLRDLRYHLIHAYLWPTQQNISDAARMGIAVATQASMQYRFAPVLVKRMGTEAIGRATPIRDWLEAGVVVAGGSDSPVTPYEPMLGIWHSVTRWVDALETVLGRPQSISPQQALEMYTRNAAWLCFAENERGMLRQGMAADWIALSSDPLTCPPQDIRSITVLTTVVGGQIVHSAR